MNNSVGLVGLFGLVVGLARVEHAVATCDAANGDRCITDHIARMPSCLSVCPASQPRGQEPLRKHGAAHIAGEHAAKRWGHPNCCKDVQDLSTLSLHNGGTEVTLLSIEAAMEAITCKSLH